MNDKMVNGYNLREYTEMLVNRLDKRYANTIIDSKDIDLELPPDENMIGKLVFDFEKGELFVAGVDEWISLSKKSANVEDIDSMMKDLFDEM